MPEPGPRGARHRPPEGTRLQATLRSSAALLGTLPPSVLASAALSRFLPLSEPVRFTLGFALAFPLWAGLICWVFLLRRAATAWAVCLGLSLALAACAWGFPR